jgi:DNA-directed RNA polymerase specialized sigma24 family protein
MHLPMSKPTDDDRQSAPALPAPASRPNLDEPSSPELPAEGDGPYASAEERKQMLVDADLKKVIRNSVRGRVPASEIEDVVQDTLAAAHGAPSLPVGKGDDRNAYVVAIARKKAIDNRRRAVRFPELGEQASVEEHVVQAVPAADMVGRDFLSRLTADLREDQTVTFRCMTRKLMGEDLAEIAREVGIPYDTLYKRVTTMQRSMREKFLRLGGVGVVLLALGLSWGAVQPRTTLAPDQPQDISLLEPAVSTHVGETDPMDWARVLRGEAFRACMNDQWMECLDGLNAAGQLDPDGEQQPAVKAARADAQSAIGAGLKPGSRWRPPTVRVYAPWASKY